MASGILCHETRVQRSKTLVDCRGEGQDGKESTDTRRQGAGRTADNSHVDDQ